MNKKTFYYSYKNDIIITKYSQELTKNSSIYIFVNLLKRFFGFRHLTLDIMLFQMLFVYVKTLYNAAIERIHWKNKKKEDIKKIFAHKSVSKKITFFIDFDLLNNVNKKFGINRDLEN